MYIIIPGQVGDSQLVSALAGLAGAFIHIEGHTLGQGVTTVVIGMDITEDITTVIIVGIPEVPGQVMQRDQETQMYIKTALME